MVIEIRAVVASEGWRLTARGMKTFVEVMETFRVLIWVLHLLKLFELNISDLCIAL